MTFGKNLSAARNRKGLTQEQLGEAMGVSRAAVTQLETDVTMPESGKIPRLATLLNVTPNQLYGFEDAYVVAEPSGPGYHLSKKAEIIGSLSDALPEWEQDDLVKRLEETKRRYDALVTELLKKRG